jgi:hypothetical protein
MHLTRELLLPYQGLNDFDGLCHIRVYEQPGQLPIVIAGGLDDNPGTSITNAIEMVAAAVQRNELSDGREFQLVEHYADTINHRGKPTYTLIHFEHRTIHERPNDPDNYAGAIVLVGENPGAEVTVARGAKIEGDFRNPRWEPVRDIQALLDCEIAVWPPGNYTARAVAGEPGERLRSKLAEHARRAREQILTAIGEDL